MSSPEERLEALASELRAAKPSASPELRERVAALRPDRSRSRRWPRLSARRVGLVLVPACVLAGVGVAVVHGVVSGSTPADRAAFRTITSTHPPAIPTAQGAPPDVKEYKAELQGTRATGVRLQRHDVQLRLRVSDLGKLSDATKAAMRTTRRLGGYIASANYNEPTTRRGVSSLVVMVPVDRVQDAIQSFSKLGDVVAQHIAIKDVQRQVDEESAAVIRLRRQIDRIGAALAGSLPSDKRTLLERRLAALQRRAHAVEAAKTATVRRASFARIVLTLVTKKTAAAHAGRFERTLRDAASVLVSEGELLLYALVVAGPLLLLAALGLGVARTSRRRGDERLLGSV